MYFLIKNDQHLITQRKRACDFINSWNVFPTLVNVERYKKKRSLAQNRTLWMWLTILSEKGMTPDAIKNYFLVKSGRCQYLNINGVMTPVFEKTSDFTVEEMSDFLNDILMQSGDWGVQLPIPDDWNYISGGKL